MSSILTNNGAIVALQTLKNVNSSLNKAQSEISTGKTINTAKDNSAVWAISKVMEADMSSAKAIQSSLNVAGATVQTAVDGADLIAKTLAEMKDLASRAGTDGYEFDKVQADIEAKTAVITATIAGTQMNGVNLLKTDGINSGDKYTVLSSLNRSDTALTAANIEVDSVDFEAELFAGANALTAISDRASAEDAVLALELNLQTALDGSAALGAKAKQIEEQSNFIGKLADSLKVGVGSLVDADMEEASARLQALQTQQQLGIQALSIANQAPSAILSLFR